MIDLNFTPVSADQARKIISDMGSDIQWPYMVTDPVTGGQKSIIIETNIDAEKTKVEGVDLPFYDGYRFYKLTDTTAPEKVRYILYKDGDVSLMNWTNEPIYSVNERAQIKLKGKEIISTYAKFFFHYVRGQMGRFIIVEKPEEVVWLPNANDKEKAEVASRLMPVTYKGLGRDNLYTLTATVVFKNALFKTDIKVAPMECDVFDPETGAPEHFSIGQMKLTNEDLLLEELNVPVAPAPGEFG